MLSYILVHMFMHFCMFLRTSCMLFLGATGGGFGAPGGGFRIVKSSGKPLLLPVQKNHPRGHPNQQDDQTKKVQKTYKHIQKCMIIHGYVCIYIYIYTNYTYMYI